MSKLIVVSYRLAHSSASIIRFIIHSVLYRKIFLLYMPYIHSELAKALKIILFLKYLAHPLYYKVLGVFLVLVSVSIMPLFQILLQSHPDIVSRLHSLSSLYISRIFPSLEFFYSLFQFWRVSMDDCCCRTLSFAGFCVLNCNLALADADRIHITPKQLQHSPNPTHYLAFL